MNSECTAHFHSCIKFAQGFFLILYELLEPISGKAGEEPGRGELEVSYNGLSSYKIVFFYLSRARGFCEEYGKQGW